MRIVILCTLLASLTSLNLTAQGKGKGKSRDKDKDKSATQVQSIPAGLANLRFGSPDVRIISDYYREPAQQLPPGLEKKLQRGGALPPGWQKKVQVFPRDLEIQLPQIPVGSRRVVYGRMALLINDATNLVLDILDLTR